MLSQSGATKGPRVTTLSPTWADPKRSKTSQARTMSNIDLSKLPSVEDMAASAASAAERALATVRAAVASPRVTDAVVDAALGAVAVLERGAKRAREELEDVAAERADRRVKEARKAEFERYIDELNEIAEEMPEEYYVSDVVTEAPASPPPAKPRRMILQPPLIKFGPKEVVVITK